MSGPASRWDAERAGAADTYDERWRRMAAAGQSVHGEADFVCRFDPESVLDAGCGTGRVAIELASRGIDVVGVDLDPAMIAEARRKAPELTWLEASVDQVDLDRRFDVVVTAGNVMIYVQPGSERSCVENLAAHVAPGGVLVSGFQLGRPYGSEQYDTDCAAAGLRFEQRFATWDGDPGSATAGYAVSVHRLVPDPA